MTKDELRFFVVDNANGPQPWKIKGGSHMQSGSGAMASRGYRITASDGTLVAHTNYSGDVFWGGHAEAKRIIAEGIEEKI